MRFSLCGRSCAVHAEYSTAGTTADTLRRSDHGSESSTSVPKVGTSSGRATSPKGSLLARATLPTFTEKTRTTEAKPVSSDQGGQAAKSRAVTEQGSSAPGAGSQSQGSDVSTAQTVGENPMETSKVDRTIDRAPKRLNTEGVSEMADNAKPSKILKLAQSEQLPDKDPEPLSPTQCSISHGHGTVPKHTRQEPATGASTSGVTTPDTTNGTTKRPESISAEQAASSEPQADEKQEGRKDSLGPRNHPTSSAERGRQSKSTAEPTVKQGSAAHSAINSHVREPPAKRSASPSTRHCSSPARQLSARLSSKREDAAAQNQAKQSGGSSRERKPGATSSLSADGKKTKCNDLKSQVDGPADFLDLSFTSCSDSSDHEGLSSRSTDSELPEKPRTRSQRVLRSGDGSETKLAPQKPTEKTPEGRERKEEGPGTRARTAEKPKGGLESRSSPRLTRRNVESTGKMQEATEDREAKACATAEKSKAKDSTTSGRSAENRYNKDNVPADKDSRSSMNDKVTRKEKRVKNTASSNSEGSELTEDSIEEHSNKVRNVKDHSSNNTKVTTNNNRKNVKGKDAVVEKKGEGADVSVPEKGDEREEGKECDVQAVSEGEASGENYDNCDDCPTDEEAEEGVVHQPLPRCPWYLRLQPGGGSHSAPTSPAAALLPGVPINPSRPAAAPPVASKDDLVLTRHAKRQQQRQKKRQERIEARAHVVPAPKQQKSDSRAQTPKQSQPSGSESKQQKTEAASRGQNAQPTTRSRASRGQCAEPQTALSSKTGQSQSKPESGRPFTKTRQSQSRTAERAPQRHVSPRDLNPAP